METEEIVNPLCLPLQKICYGLGHIFNDLCAAMWFSYTLFYFQVVLNMESTMAGMLLMTGQVIDSLATPVAGWAIDATGYRRLWHLGGAYFSRIPMIIIVYHILGSIAVAIGFALLFSLKPTTFDFSTMSYYFFNIILFQVGWAIVQISHLSIIPEISRSHHHSSDLTTIRYVASVCCSLAVYLITLIILKHDVDVDSESIGPNDFFKFKEIALIITFIGILTSMLFYCGLLGTYNDEYEVLRGSDNEDVNNLASPNNGHFLKSYVIYMVALMYMASRLFTILNLIYIPLYIDERSALDEVEKEKLRQTIATVPLVSYVASFIMAILLKLRNGVCNDKVTYFIGTLFGLLASILIGIGVPLNSDGELYTIAFLLGISGSSTMVASLCLTANFVKTNGYGGGFVYSIVTFTDKLISGAVVLLVQNLQCTPRSSCPYFFENVLSYICGIVSLVGLVSLLSLELLTKRNLVEVK